MVADIVIASIDYRGRAMQRLFSRGTSGMTSCEAHAYDVWACGMVLTLHRDRTLIPAIVAPFMSLAVRRIAEQHLRVDPAALGYAEHWLKQQGWSDDPAPRKRMRSGSGK